MTIKKIAIIGMGNMGGAIASALAPHYELSCFSNGDDLSKAAESDLIFLCVKPQQLDSLNLPELKSSHIVVSILAGTFLESIRQLTGSAKLVRLMPTLCAGIKRSINAYYSSENVNIESVFEKFGTNIKLDSEKDFASFTPVFGSGPAHLLYILKAFKKFRPDTDEKVLLELLESTALWAKQQDKSFDQLISDVTSKGGITEAIHNTWNTIDLPAEIIKGLDAGKKKEENF